MEQQQLYPTITARLKAAVIDILVIMSIMIAAAYVFSYFTDAPDYYRVSVFVFIFFLYDPFCISLFGGTIGHLTYGLRVKDEKKPDKNISFPLAIFRFIVKANLGWISFFTVTGTEKKRAIHDYAVGSIVFYKNSFQAVRNI